MMEKNNISNQIKNNVGALNSQVGMAKQQMQQAINNAKSQAMSGLSNMTNSVDDDFFR